MRFSIVTPTFNEEKHLPILLESIKNQTFKDYEIIVADHKSPDKTREIARKYGAKVVDGNMPGPARNAGAKVAKGEYLVFFDADITIKPDFLEKVDKALKKNKLDGATTSVHPISKHLFDWFFFVSANIGSRILQYFKPVAHGFDIIVKRSVFEKIKGFDEELEIGEDFDLARRIGKAGKFRVISHIILYVSVRRFDKEGRMKLFWTLLKSTVRILFFNKRITKSHYDFGKYD